MENLKNKLITIYGKGGTYKSTISKLFLNGNSCYMDVEKNNYTLDDIYNNINNYDIVVIDYIELLGLTIDDLMRFKNLIKDENKTLVIVSCCSSTKDLFNEHYNSLKEVSDIILLTNN